MKSVVYALFLTVSLSPCVWAEEPASDNLEAQIAAVRAQIDTEESLQEELRQDLAAMDEKVEALRRKLEELEARITENQ